jgi:hypothetical protein
MLGHGLARFFLVFLASQGRCTWLDYFEFFWPVGKGSGIVLGLNLFSFSGHWEGGAIVLLDHGFDSSVYFPSSQLFVYFPSSQLFA